LKRKLVTRFQKYLLNPLTRRVAGRFPGWILLETTGRITGRKRRTPLGGTRDGRSFWVVSEQGRRADYVRNIEANPRVRVRMGGRWVEGSAHVVPDDDADARRRTQSRWNRSAVRAFGTDLLSVRIDLDPG
jgi:deazaflavin-dependent oxidoreductase (nitroreductase family)